MGGRMGEERGEEGWGRGGFAAVRPPLPLAGVHERGLVHVLLFSK